MKKLLKKRREEEKIKRASNPLFTKEYKLKYITSNSSFNIPCNGIQCDWHQIQMLKSGEFITHPKVIIGAEDIFYDRGLYDCSSWLNERGFNGLFLCATPIRAMIDKLYYEIVVLKRSPLFDISDFMFEEVDLIEFNKWIDELHNAIPSNEKIALKKWRQNNIKIISF
jgi:hypothetical protein